VISIKVKKLLKVLSNRFLTTLILNRPRHWISTYIAECDMMSASLVRLHM